jgi:hypothetical protein
MKIMKKIFLLLAVLLCSLALPTAAKADVTLDATNFPDSIFRAYISTLTGVVQGGTITQSKLDGITAIDCHYKNITDIKGIENFTALKVLKCQLNKITSLNLSHNAALTYLSCNNNKIANSLDLSQNTKLTEVNFNANKITALNLGKDNLITKLQCWGNDLTTLDVTNLKALTELDAGCNEFNEIDLSQNTLLNYLELGGCENLLKLDLSHNTALKVLHCYATNLTTLDLSHNSLLTTFYSYSCYLCALDLSNNPKLTFLDMANNMRLIKVYSYTRSAAHGGGTGYYVPLTAQDAKVDGDGKTYGPTKSLATLIDDSGQADDTAFDITKVVANTWGGGATLGTLNGTQVLFLNTSKKYITYQYKTGFTGNCSKWYVIDHKNITTCPAPNAYFTLKWSTDTSQVVTGVDGVESNDVSVYTVNGAINIGGSFDGNVNVYNLRGQQVYCGTDSEVAVPAGVYIVKVNGKAHKVLVK